MCNSGNDFSRDLRDSRAAVSVALWQKLAQPVALARLMQPASHSWPVWLVLLVKALELGYEYARPIELRVAPTTECTSLSPKVREQIVDDPVTRLEQAGPWESRRRG